MEGKDTEKVQKRIKNDPKFATYNPRRRGTGVLSGMKFMNMIFETLGDLSLGKLL